jgi:hypothetical protein
MNRQPGAYSGSFVAPGGLTASFRRVAIQVPLIAVKLSNLMQVDADHCVARVWMQGGILNQSKRWRASWQARQQLPQLRMKPVAVFGRPRWRGPAD